MPEPTQAIRLWLLGRRPQIELLPGRPPRPGRRRTPPRQAEDVASTQTRPADDPRRFGPAASATDPRQPQAQMRAITCSGGGIRAAAFALGGMQRLGRRSADGAPSFYERTHLVTAVSGGSYMASSFAMVNHNLSAEQRAEMLPYAPGSPEDNRLRAHTRYLVEDPRVAAVGVLSILYGLLLNLLPILAVIFVGAKLLGWALHDWRLLRPSAGDSWAAGNLGGVILTGVVIGGVALVLFAIDRLHDVYAVPDLALKSFTRAWTLRLLVLAVAVLVLFAGVPALVAALDTARLPGNGVPAANQLTGFAATTAAIVALVKGTLGRFRGTLQPSSAKRGGMIGATIAKGLRWLAPWVGSLLAVGLLIVALLGWTTAAAYHGLHPRDIVWIFAALLGTLAWQGLTDVNRNSVHPFYKERLCSAFAVERVRAWRDGVPYDEARELLYSRAVSFSDYAGDSPELVVCAAVNTDEEGVVPSGRACAPWTFSPSWTGISAGTMFGGEDDGIDRDLMMRAREYEALAGRRLVTLPGAVAVSGAAISPVMGRMTRAPLRLLLGLANVRLGLWLPNPRMPLLPHAPAPEASVVRRVLWQVRQPGILALLAEILGRTSLRRRWVYVTDGGHYENLGLVEALRRGATEIVAFDASGDPPFSWSTFGQAVETARADLGVEISLDPTGMRPRDDLGRAPTLVARGVCRYPNGVEADLLLCKLALPVSAEASWDVFAWAHGHSAFPNDSTAQQLYGDREFEAYRRLGEVAADAALEVLAKEARLVDLTVAQPMVEREVGWV